MHWDCLHDPRLHSRLDSIINDRRWALGESHGNVSLHQQIYRAELLFCIIAITKKLFQAPQLCWQIVKSKRYARVIFVRDQQAITFRHIDLANLKARLQKAARA